jgi:phosphoglycerate kinase
MWRLQTLSDISCKGKKVLVRVDFHVPIDSRRNVLDNSRIVAALQTIRYLVQEGGMAILASDLRDQTAK